MAADGARTSLRALLLEDSDEDAELLRRELGLWFDVTWKRAQDGARMRELLVAEPWDIILSDFSMPGFTAMDALDILHESGRDIPFIIVSGTIGEEVAVDALKKGAHDFLIKGRFARLQPTILRELRDARGRRERAVAEEALRISELKYRRIVETAREGIWVIDASNVRTTYVNRRMAELLRASIGDVLTAPVSDFVDADWRSIHAEKLARSRLGLPDEYEFKFRRRDGSDFWARVSTNPINDEAGRFLGALAMVTDITEQKQLNAQLIMSDRMVSVGMLAAGVAHEINNPLAALIANLDLAQAEVGRIGQEVELGAAGDDLREILTDARAAANRVRLIVRDLRIFSRSEEDRRGPVDLHRTIESTLRMAYNEIRHRARLVKDFAPSLPQIEANESRLGQVFLNLVVNAAQAITEGRAEDNEIRISTRTDASGAAVVEIRDTGAGIPEEVKSKLFTPFFTTKPASIGTGLGLVICQRIVSDLGGSIELSSEVGRGTVVRITLPPTRTAELAEDQAPATKLATRRGRILVVDDDVLVRGALLRTLSGEHEVVVEGKAQDALVRLAGGERFDVILCDLMMPQMSGMEFHQELAKLDPRHLASLVYLTGGAFTARAREFLDQVQAPRIEKPFDPEALRLFVNDRIRG
jgi:PAS domain S-box-containing protein